MMINVEKAPLQARVIINKIVIHNMWFLNIHLAMQSTLIYSFPMSNQTSSVEFYFNFKTKKGT